MKRKLSTAAATASPVSRQPSGAKVVKTVAARSGEKIMKATDKDEIVTRIQDALEAGARMGYSGQFIIGVNSVSRQLEANNVSVIAIVRDSELSLHQHISVAAKLRNVPVRYLPRCAAELGQVFNIRRVSCFAVAKGHSTVQVKSNDLSSSNSVAISHQEQIQVILDDIHERLLSRTEIIDD
jgi:ribosomal protein L7Ae-like RNA K-turn-binding protein